MCNTAAFCGDNNDEKEMTCLSDAASNNCYLPIPNYDTHDDQEVIYKIYFMLLI